MKKINCILLVDDNQADNKYHEIIITEAAVCNYIKIVKDGKQALEYILKAAISENGNEYPKAELIFLDINMPRMNGFEFLEEYHKLDDKIKAHSVIIMLSTSSNPDDKKKAKGFREVSSFVTKPLTIELVKKIVEDCF